MKLFNNLSKSKILIYRIGFIVFTLGMISLIFIDKAKDITNILFSIWAIYYVTVLIWNENRKTILMIEDEEVLARLYKETLEKEGYKVITLPETTEIYKILDRERVDLITLDIMLPKQDGIEFLEEFKDKRKYKKVPIVMLNNLTSQDIIDKCYELGAKDYWITSEVQPDELSKRIEKFFSSANIPH